MSSKTITGSAPSASASGPDGSRAASSGAATGRYRSRPSGRTEQPGTGSAEPVTAAITRPSRSSAAVWSSSSRRSSKLIPGTAVSASRNQVASESAFTATDTRVGSPAPLIPSSSRASRSSRASWRAYRTRTAPESVGRTGLVRLSSTRPVRCSSAFTRWLTADGVTCSTAAAASKVPSSTTASSVRTCSRGSSFITRAKGS